MDVPNGESRTEVGPAGSPENGPGQDFSAVAESAPDILPTPVRPGLSTRPTDETNRIEALHRYQILDTPSEQDFDDIALLASHVCQASIALISLVDANRVWFKSHIGLPVKESPREHSFCAQGILQRDVFVVSDTETDPRFAEHPMMIGASRLRSYAGFPLVSAEGYAVGMLCVGDQTPRSHSPDQIAALKALSRQAVSQLELRRSLIDQHQANQKRNTLEATLYRKQAELTAIESGTKFGSWEMDLVNGGISLSSGMLNLIGRESSSGPSSLKEFSSLIHPDDAARFNQMMSQARSENRMHRLDFRFRHPDGSTRWFAWTSNQVMDEQNKRVRLAGTVQDITEQQRTTDRLHSYAQRLALVTESAQVGIWEWEIHSKLLRWDARTFSIYGQPVREYVTYDTWAAFVHPEDLLQTEQTLRRVITQTVQGTFGFRIIRSSDGAVRSLQAAAGISLEQHGQVTKVVGVLFDVTDRKQSECELEHLHRQLLEASRRGGMAKIATNVLHNVGNVLSSANISTNLVIDCLRNSKVPSMAKVAELLKEHDRDLGRFLESDPRGQQLPVYLSRLANHLLAERTTVTDELESLRQNIDHLKEIVTLQQNYAHACGVKEFIRLPQLIEDSLRMSDGALIRHGGIEIIREYEEVPPMNLEKHKVLQILINLVGNAKHACDESGRSDKHLTIRLARNGNRIAISVGDNGSGITADNLGRIFSHGFTTRTGGHGFGLHSGAIAAREMGGTLTVQSDGPDRGATFTLQLPIQTEEK